MGNVAKITVAVFMSTYNGEEYLTEQIESLKKQEDVELKLLVRDDGSKDKTREILKKYQDQGVLKFYTGPNMGYAKSFMDLVNQPVKADYYAFCDQDDVWLPEKLSAAIHKIKKIEPKEAGPILYTSALQRVDRNLDLLPKQEFKNLKLTLGAEFTRHRLAGCAFVFNNELRNLLIKAGDCDGVYISHDKLTTMLCIACKGTVIFDSNSYIFFRRHGDNASPDGIGTKEKILKDIHHFTSHRSHAPKLAGFILHKYKNYLSPESAAFLKLVNSYKSSFGRTLSLSLNKNIDCGFWFYNWFIRGMILIRIF